MNYRERRTYWRKAIIQQNKLEREYFPKVQKVIQQQISSFIEEARRVGFMAAYQRWNTEVVKGDLFKVIMNLYKRSGLLFANMTYRNIKSGLKYRTMGFNEEWTNAVVSYLGSEGLKLVNWMDDTTKQYLIDILSQGMTEGWGFDEVVSRIENSPISDKFRIMRIVRTESMRAANYGAMLGAKSHNLLMKKEWISAHDNRVRQWAHKDQYDHLALDGMMIKMDDKFTQTSLKGVVAQAEQPGDPKAPAAFTVNCRCVVGFEAQRDANGRLIRTY